MHAQYTMFNVYTTNNMYIVHTVHIGKPMNEKNLPKSP